MASDQNGYQPGSMDITAHEKTWIGFVAFTKWSTIGLLTIMAFLAIFRTN